MYNNLYCKVYLNSELEIEELYQYINCKVLGRLEPIRTIITDWGEMDLRKNNEFNPQRLIDDPENFVFRYRTKKQIDQSDYIDQIAKLLKDLNSDKRRCSLRRKSTIRSASYCIKAVASCDFEKDLNMDCFEKNSGLHI